MLVESRSERFFDHLTQEIKQSLDKGAGECIESTSTWIKGDQQITETTVKTHVSAILGKLGVNNRVQAILAAGEWLESRKGRHGEL